MTTAVSVRLIFGTIDKLTEILIFLYVVVEWDSQFIYKLASCNNQPAFTAPRAFLQNIDNTRAARFLFFYHCSSFSDQLTLAPAGKVIFIS